MVVVRISAMEAHFGERVRRKNVGLILVIHQEEQVTRVRQEFMSTIFPNGPSQSLHARRQTLTTSHDHDRRMQGKSGQLVVYSGLDCKKIS